MLNRENADWLNAYMEYTENTEPPKTFHRWTAIACLAAALQRKCKLDWGTLTFYPNMYVVLVAPSGRARKGTAMSFGLKFLEKLQVNMAAEATTREALILALKESDKMETTDRGIEVHSSLTIYSPELAVFLGYKNEQLLSDLTDWYDCRTRWTYRTKTQGTDEIQKVWVNLFGATTPSLLQSTLPTTAIGGGLTSRMIFVYERDKYKTVPAPFLTRRQKELQESLLRDLERIHLMHGTFKPTGAFVKRWTEWYLKADHNPPFDDERLSGYCERRPNHVMKLALIMSAAHRTDLVVDVEDLERAITTLEEVECKMPNALTGVGRSQSSDLVGRIMQFVGTKGRVEVGKIATNFYYDANYMELANTLKQMQQMGVIKGIRTERGDYLEITSAGKNYLGGRYE